MLTMSPPLGIPTIGQPSAFLPGQRQDIHGSFVTTQGSLVESVDNDIYSSPSMAYSLFTPPPSGRQSTGANSTVEPASGRSSTQRE